MPRVSQLADDRDLHALPTLPNDGGGLTQCHETSYSPWRTTLEIGMRSNMMVRFIATCAGCLVFGHLAAAQVEVACRLYNDQYLQCEDIPALMTIQNQTPWPVIFGEGGNGDIAFRIERRPGKTTRDSGVPVEVDPYEILPGRKATLEVGITRSYDIGKTGPYTLWPIVTHKEQTYTGSRMVMDVVPGFNVASKKIVFDGDAGVEKRLVSVRTIGRSGAQFAFLRVENQQGSMCYGLNELGRYLSTSKPKLLADSSGRIHVLHLSRPRRYTYGIHNMNGAAIERKFYARQLAEASLRYNDEGSVIVAGVSQYEGDTSIERPRVHRFDPFESTRD